jgi:hypothetical protein
VSIEQSLTYKDKIASNIEGPKWLHTMMLEEIYTKSVLLVMNEGLLHHFDLFDGHFSNRLDILEYILITLTRVGGYTSIPPT